MCLGLGERTWQSLLPQSLALPVRLARISVRRDIKLREVKAYMCPQPYSPSPTRSHKADLLRYFDLTDDASMGVVREAGGITDTERVGT